MQSVSPGFLEIFNSNEQGLDYRVELLESSGYNFPEDVEVEATASSTKNTSSGSGSADTFFAASNVADGQSSEPIKYAVLDQAACKLDNNFCLGGAGAKYTPGWWSEVKADGSGNFASPPYVVVEYSPAVEANRIRVSTTTVYTGAHTVNIQVWYSGDPGYTDLGDFEFGSGARVVADLATGAELKQVSKIKVSVKKAKAASVYARLTEIEPVVERSVETLGTLEDFCEGMSIRKSSGAISSYTPAAPGFGINEASFTLSREAGITPAENQLLIISAGYAGELLRQGVFIITEAKPGLDGWNITAHGILSLSAYHRYPDSVWNNVKVSVVLKRLLEWIGIAEEEIAFDLTSDTTWEWYITEGGNCDEALRKAAETFGVAIYENEAGGIVVRNDYGASVMTITDDLIDDIDPTRPEEINYIIVHYGNIRRGQADYVLSGSAPLAASETATFVLRFSKSPAMDTRPPFIDGFRDADNQEIATLPTIEEWSADAYSATVKVKNNTAQAGIFSVKVWGIPLDKGSNEAIYEAVNTASVKRRGIRSFEATIYTNSAARAKAYGDNLLKYLKACSGALTVTLNRPAPHLQLRDVVTVTSDEFSIDADFVIAEIDLDEDDMKLTLLPDAAVI